MQNGYEKSDRGDNSPRLKMPDIGGGNNKLKGGYRVGSGGLNQSDVIFDAEEMVKENSVSNINMKHELNGPVFIQGNPNEFVEGLENFGEDMNK